MKTIVTTFIFCLITSISFADTTKLRGLYKNSYQITRTELMEHLGTTDIKFICQEYCTGQRVTIIVVKDKDTGKKTWVWSADLYVHDTFHSQSFSYDFLIEHDKHGQITSISLGLDFPKKEKPVNVDVSEREYNSDPIDWKEIRRRTQESIDANK